MDEQKRLLDVRDKKIHISLESLGIFFSYFEL